MAISQRRSLIRRAVSVSAVAIVATLLGASSPVASAAPTTVKAPTVTSLDTAANWAVVKAAAKSGYAVSAKLAASCGATQ